MRSIFHGSIRNAKKMVTIRTGPEWFKLEMIIFNLSFLDFRFSGSNNESFPKINTFAFLDLFLINFQKYHSIRIRPDSSSLYRISRMGGGSRQAWGGVLFYIGEIKNFALFQTRKFSKNVKKSTKIL